MVDVSGAPWWMALKGTDAVRRRGRMRMTVAGENQEAMGVLRFNGTPWWEAAVAVEEVCRLEVQFEAAAAGFRRIRWQANGAPHDLAR